MLQIGEFARLGQVSPRMLRHYDELGLLKPAHADARTGYRGYEIGQLARLHRLIALRELGLSLDQVREVLDEEPPVDQLRGMLRLRQAELEADMADQQARLRRIDAHLRALEGRDAMPVLDVVVKTTDPVTIAEVVGTAPGFGHANIGPVFEELVDDIATTYEALVRWIDDGGYRLAGRSRELYLEWDGEHAHRNVTELQIPIAS